MDGSYEKGPPLSFRGLKLTGSRFPNYMKVGQLARLAETGGGRGAGGGYCKCSGNVAAHELRWMNASYFHPAFSGIMKAREVGTREHPGDMFERRSRKPG